MHRDGRSLIQRDRLAVLGFVLLLAGQIDPFIIDLDLHFLQAVVIGFVVVVIAIRGRQTFQRVVPGGALQGDGGARVRIAFFVDGHPVDPLLIGVGRIVVGRALQLHPHRVGAGIVPVLVVQPVLLQRQAGGAVDGFVGDDPGLAFGGFAFRLGVFHPVAGQFILPHPDLDDFVFVEDGFVVAVLAGGGVDCLSRFV